MKTLNLILLVLSLALVAACGEKKEVASPAEARSDAADGAAGKPKRSSEELRVRFDLLARGFLPSVAVEVVPTPDGKSFFVLGRNGQVFHYDRPIESLEVGDGKAVRPGMKMSFDDVYSKGDLGSIGMTLDPAFADNGFFYVWCADAKDENVYLDRFAFKGDAEATLASRTRVIGFSRSQPEGPYHMGGILQFLPDGTLLIMTGDAEHPEISQDRKNLNGKILRIRPRPGPDGGYDVPADNPHAKDPDWAPEIVATGLRAPFRGFYHQNRHFFIADVGAVHEEINHWVADPTVPADFGWGLGATGKVKQGQADGPLDHEGSIDPIIYWTREKDFSGDDPDYAGETRMSAGIGPVYGAGGIDRYDGRLSGRLVFFDIMRGWVRAARLDDAMKVIDHGHIGHMAFLAHVFEGRDGYVYALTWGPVPSIYRMVAAEETAER